MKKRVMAAAILAAAAALIALGGCELQGDDGGEVEETFSVKDAPIYDVDTPTSLITGVNGEVQLYDRGDEYDEMLAVGTLTDGRLTFALPDTLPQAKLTAPFAQFADFGGTIEPVDHRVFVVVGLAIYDDSRNLLGTLTYCSDSTGSEIRFLYSKEPLTVVINSGFDIEAASGWNYLKEDTETSFLETVVGPPEDAKWIYARTE